MPPELRKLFERYVNLGALLNEDVDLDDSQAVAAQTLVLREMANVNEQIKKFLING